MSEIEVTAVRRRTGGSWAAAGMAGVLAFTLSACGIAPQSSGSGAASAPASAGSTAGTSASTGTGSDAPSASASGGESAAPSAGGPAASPAGTLTFANWPLYIDIDEETGGYPTLEKFEQEAGIDVTYSEDINDNEEFFGRIQPDLAAGNPTGYDLIVVTDWMVERMIRLGYLEELDQSQLANVTENMVDVYRDPWYDPGNRYSVPYQSGITGIAYNPTLTGREITSFDDLLDPEFAGRVGIFSEMRDTLCLALLSMGVEPTEATIEDVEAAQQKLLEAADRGQFRAAYGNDYYDALAAGDLAITVAWSGDISQMKLYDNPDIEFVVPETGGMLWVDNMVIPKGAEHPVDAHRMMDFWYDLENAVPLTEYVGYFSPVEGVPERVLEDAEAAREEGDEEWAGQLEVISETAFPTNEQLENVHTYPQLTEEEERAWNELFNEVITD